MRKKLLAAAITLILMLATPFVASAHAMQPPPITLEVIDAPDNLTYLDFLVPKDLPAVIWTI